MNDNVKEWLKVATYDVDTVELLIREKGHASIIIYHMHQAVEKLLKSILVNDGLEIVKSHNIDKMLSDILEKHPTLLEISKGVLAVHSYLPKLRYPYGDKLDFEEALTLYPDFMSGVMSLRNCITQKQLINAI